MPANPSRLELRPEVGDDLCVYLTHPHRPEAWLYMRHEFCDVYRFSGHGKNAKITEIASYAVDVPETEPSRLGGAMGHRGLKAKGRLRGKQPKLNPRQEAHLAALHHAGEHGTAELGDLFASPAPPSTAPSSAK